MEYSTILVKVIGAVLLLWTARSIYKHFLVRKPGNVVPAGATGEGLPKNDKKPSMTEQFLNNLLLYLWLAFMVIFSTGMIVNN